MVVGFVNTLRSSGAAGVSELDQLGAAVFVGAVAPFGHGGGARLPRGVVFVAGAGGCVANGFVDREG